MARWVEAEFLSAGRNVHSHRDGKYWNGEIPWVPYYPRTVDAPRFSGRVLAHMRTEHEKYMEIVRLWSLLPYYYVTEETDQVREAMNPVSLKVDGLLKAAETLDSAVSLYDSAVPEPMGFKLDHDRWARDAYSRLHHPVGETEEEKTEQFELVMQEIEERDVMVASALQVLQSARQTIADVLTGVDVDELGEAKFTVMEGGLDVAASREELELMIMESDLFGSDLTWEQVHRLADEIDLDALPFDYVDEQGRKWISNADGVRVRVGSAMDPNLNQQMILAIGSDPETSHIQIPTGYDDDGNVVLTSASEIVQFAAGEVADKTGSTLKHAWTGFELLMLAPTMYLAGSTARTNAQANGVLMSNEDLQQVYAHYSDQAFFSTTASSIASLGTTTATALVVYPTMGPSGVVVVYAVDQATGEIVSSVVEGIYDDTWTQGELGRKENVVVKADEFDKEEYERLKQFAQDRSVDGEGTAGTPSVPGASNGTTKTATAD